MKLVMTLLVRDEADIVDAQLAFHLNAGVDYVIATDHRSVDGTTEVLDRYARAGHLRLIRQNDIEYREVEWRTQMARLAATELGADWVFHSDADEFWLPRACNLKEALATVAAGYGIVRAFWRPFVLRPNGDGFFAERMTVRLAAHAAINDPTSQFRPNAKVIHRADPRLAVGRGNHALLGATLPVLLGWYPIEVLHFPLRSLEQLKRKAAVYRASEQTRLHDGHRRLHRAFETGTIGSWSRAFAVDAATLERGLADGTLVVDTRLRDVLRVLAGSLPLPAAPQFTVRADEDGGAWLSQRDPADEAAYAVEAAVLREADAIRLQRRLDELAGRLTVLERSGSAR